mgnify:CR=1 FL=1
MSMISIISRVSGSETYRRFNLSNSTAAVAYMASLAPGAYVGYCLGARAETCRPGRPRGEEDAGEFYTNEWAAQSG